MTSRWGILGTGRMAARFAADLGRVDDAELVAVGSRSAERASAFAQEHGAQRAWAGYRAVAEDPNVDVVYIATPHSQHAENMMLCLSQGRHVLCEKPFTINAAQARRAIALARASGLFLMEAMWTRFIPAVARMRALIDQGAIGTPRLMVAGGAFIPDDPEHYLFRPELGGGVLLDAGVYLVSMASMVFGAPGRVAAMGVLGDTGVDEHDGILLECEGGALAVLYVSLRARASPGMSLLGSAGRIDLAPPIFCPQAMTLERADEPARVIDLPVAPNGYQYQIEEVNRCLREGALESPMMPLDETLSIMQTLDEIRARIGLAYPGERVEDE